jgi:O-Antigen ligase
VLCRALCVLLFLAWTAEEPNDSSLFYGQWRSAFSLFSPLFETIPGVQLWTWQILLFALAPLSLLQPGAFRRRPWVMDIAILASIASVAVTFAWGVSRGGSAYQAYYQLWRFLAALLVGLMLVSTIRSPRDLRAVGLTVLAAAFVRGTLAYWFYVFHVRGTRLANFVSFMTSHDDSVLWVAGILVPVAWALVRMTARSWIVAVFTFLYLFGAMILNGRRLAWVELAFSLALAYTLLPSQRVRRQINRLLLLSIPVVALYVAVGWGRDGLIWEPVRALSTSGSDSDASSLARLEEVKNLIYTLVSQGNPILGTGWGHPYIKVTSTYANLGGIWSQYLYMPHNSLLAVAVFGGLVGLFGIWMVVPVTAFLGIRGYRQATDARSRAGCVAAVCLLPAYGVQCYGDIGFQSLTGSLLLGVAIGVAARVSAWGAPRAASLGRRTDLEAQRSAEVEAEVEPRSLTGHLV